METKKIYINESDIRENEIISYCNDSIIRIGKFKPFAIPYEINPTSEHNFETCEKCLKDIEYITQKLKARGFPLCCDWHKNLTKRADFNIDDFANVPEMTAKKIKYTIRHIIDNIEKDDYVDDIGEYIEYAIQSFGQMPEGCGSPLYIDVYCSYIGSYIKEMQLPDSKKAKLEDILKTYTQPKKHEDILQTDINILISTYEKWRSLFPFEISYFANLREKFKKEFPVIKSVEKTNRYSNVVWAIPHTKNSLLDVLFKITDKLICEINSCVLYDKGQLTDTAKIKLELIISARKMKLKEGYANKSATEYERFRKIIKDWLTDEQKFLKEVAECLKEQAALPSPKNKDKPDLDSKTDYEIRRENLTAIYNFYIDEKIISENDISELEFMNYLSNANYKIILEKAKQKRAKEKALYMIYYLTNNKYDWGFNANWYKDTAKSINASKSECSGARIEPDWRKIGINIKDPNKN